MSDLLWQKVPAASLLSFWSLVLNNYLYTSRSSPHSSVGGGARVLLEQVLCLPVGWKEHFMICRTFSCRRSPRRVSILSWGHTINNRRIVPVLTKFSCLNISLLYSSSRRMERSSQEMLDFLLERWTSSYCTPCTAFQPHTLAAESARHVLLLHDLYDPHDPLV